MSENYVTKAVRQLVYFAGATGPDASGGAMALAYMIAENGAPVRKGGLFMPPSFDGSWHSATYHALAFAMEQCRGLIDPSATFVTDNEMVVSQMRGTRGVKGGHYVEAREDAIGALIQAFPSRESNPEFFWVPQHENPAAPPCVEMLREHSIEPWTYRKNSADNREIADPRR